MNKVLISVPASSANLGPGFDTLGVCFEKRNVFTFEKRFAHFTFDGIAEQYQNEDNLAVVAFKEANRYMNADEYCFHMSMKENEVPISRGLGSSSTFILAGILAANAFNNYVLSAEEILRLASKVEGHPDNVCAALFGGLTMAMVDNGIANYVKYDPDPALHFTVFIPDFKLSTEQARSVLPKQYERADIVYNIQHVLFLMEGLKTGDEDMIKASLKDKIHVPYRRNLIPEYDLIENAALQAGALAVTISGAGPTILAISKGALSKVHLNNELNGKIQVDWTILDLPISPNGCYIEEL